MRTLLAVVVALALAACASMGRPEGGPRDTEPPVFVSSNPMPGELNVTRNRIRVTFNENVNVTDAMSKILVSPVQKDMPSISSSGRHIDVELRDSLIPNTTYTIDFTDAITDLNEGNPLDGFALDFSTGSTLDSLRISGMVFEAATLEPAQGMIVGAYSNLSDTAISTLPLERITKTNQLGQFTLRNLKPGQYRLFALNDQNRDNKWDRTEDIAFYPEVITPSAETVSVTDTLKSSAGADSIVVRSHTRFMPNDVLITWFNEEYKAQYMVKNDRRERNIISIEMGAPSDTFPILTLLNSPRAGQRLTDVAVISSSATRDTIDYWLTDSLVYGLDSLTVEARYLRTDSLDQLSWTTDTIQFNLRGSKTRAAELKRQKEADEKRRKAIEKGDSVPPVPTPLLTLRAVTGSTQDIPKPLLLNAAKPVASIDTNAVHFHILDDTLWVELEPPVIYFPDSLKPMQMRIDYEWEPGAKYRLTVDSLGITDIYGDSNGPFTHEFTVRKVEDYSNIIFHVSGLNGPGVVQLLSSSDKPVMQAPVQNGDAVFRFVLPGKYYARLFADRDTSGTYTPGSLTLNRLPEDVYYFPKLINLKKNWDLEQQWDINEQPVDLQKPAAIKKNKPKPKPGELPEQQQYTDEDDDTFGNGFGNNTGSRRGNNSNMRLNGDRTLQPGNTTGAMSRPMRPRFI